MRWTQEMAVKFLHRESSGDAPGHPPPSRLRFLPTHVVHQLFGCIRPHQPHWPQSCILHRDCGHQDVIIRMSIPNASIDCSLRLMGGGLARNCLSYRPPPTGALAVTSKHEHYVVRSARPLCPVAVYWDQWAYWSKTVDIRRFNQPEYQRDSLTCTLGLLTSTGPIRRDWCAVYAILRTLILCTLLLLYTTRYKMSAFRYPAML